MMLWSSSTYNLSVSISSVMICLQRQKNWQSTQILSSADFQSWKWCRHHFSGTRMVHPSVNWSLSTVSCSWTTKIMLGESNKDIHCKCWSSTNDSHMVLWLFQISKEKMHSKRKAFYFWLQNANLSATHLRRETFRSTVVNLYLSQWPLT